MLAKSIQLRQLQSDFGHLPQGQVSFLNWNCKCVWKYLERSIMYYCKHFFSLVNHCSNHVSHINSGCEDKLLIQVNTCFILSLIHSLFFCFWRQCDSPTFYLSLTHDLLVSLILEKWLKCKPFYLCCTRGNEYQCETMI